MYFAAAFFFLLLLLQGDLGALPWAALVGPRASGAPKATAGAAEPLTGMPTAAVPQVTLVAAAEAPG